MLAAVWFLYPLFVQCLCIEGMRRFKDINIAFNKRARQTSTFGSYGAQLAVDGKSDGFFDSGSCSCTSMNVKVKGSLADVSWWEVDLGSHFNIGQICIFNRGDCCSERLHDFRIEVVNGRRFRKKARKTCGNHRGNAPTGWLNVTCKEPLVGRIVRITKQKNTKKDSLTLCEVEIYEAADPELMLNRHIRRYDDKRLQSKELQTTKGDSLLQCSVRCSTSRSYSFNYRRSSGEASVCEIIPYRGNKAVKAKGYTNYVMK